jgi:hypothetical protein
MPSHECVCKFYAGGHPWRVSARLAAAAAMLAYIKYAQRRFSNQALASSPERISRRTRCGGVKNFDCFALINRSLQWQL